jgi:hypothetical protein
MVGSMSPPVSSSWPVNRSFYPPEDLNHPPAEFQVFFLITLLFFSAIQLAFYQALHCFVRFWPFFQGRH